MQILIGRRVCQCLNRLLNEMDVGFPDALEWLYGFTVSAEKGKDFYSFRLVEGYRKDPEVGTIVTVDEAALNRLRDLITAILEGEDCGIEWLGPGPLEIDDFAEEDDE